jgi:hypothetical protein
MTTTPKSDREGADYKQGPNPAPGGEIDTGDSLVPPYEGRTTAETASAARRQSVEQILEHTKAGHPGATASPAVESPVRPEEVTDKEPDTPLGVGESTTTRGEDQVKKQKEPGRHDAGYEGNDRPTGTSDERDVTGI